MVTPAPFTPGADAPPAPASAPTAPPHLQQPAPEPAAAPSAPAQLADDILAFDFSAPAALAGHTACMEASEALCRPIGEEVQAQVLALDQVGKGGRGRGLGEGEAVVGARRPHLLSPQPDAAPDLPALASSLPPSALNRLTHPLTPSHLLDASFLQLGLEIEAQRRQAASMHVCLAIYRSSLAFTDTPAQVGSRVGPAGWGWIERGARVAACGAVGPSASRRCLQLLHVAPPSPSSTLSRHFTPYHPASSCPTQALGFGAAKRKAAAKWEDLEERMAAHAEQEARYAAQRAAAQAEQEARAAARAEEEAHAAAQAEQATLEAAQQAAAEAEQEVREAAQAAAADGSAAQGPTPAQAEEGGAMALEPAAPPATLQPRALEAAFNAQPLEGGSSRPLAPAAEAARQECAAGGGREVSVVLSAAEDGVVLSLAAYLGA